MPEEREEPEKRSRIEREIEILGLQREAADAAGGQMTSWEAEDLPLDVSEKFWRRVVDFENAPETTHFDQLVRAGLVLPPPEQLDDEQLADALSQMFDRLADLRIFVTSTDHLSDRELYEHFWNEGLRQPVPDLVLDADSACHIDLVSSGSEEDTECWLRYYADEAERRDWQEQFPEDQLPERQKPPYDRDRYLPQATYGPPGE